MGQLTVTVLPTLYRVLWINSLPGVCHTGTRCLIFRKKIFQFRLSKFQILFLAFCPECPALPGSLFCIPYLVTVHCLAFLITARPLVFMIFFVCLFCLFALFDLAWSFIPLILVPLSFTLPFLLLCCELGITGFLHITCRCRMQEGK